MDADIDTDWSLAFDTRRPTRWHKLGQRPREWARSARRRVLDLQCLAYVIRLRAGSWVVCAALLIVVLGFATQFDAAQTVVLGVAGAFGLERYWESRTRRSHRRLASGISFRVRYKPFGPDQPRYCTMQLARRTCGPYELGVPGTRSTTEMQLHRRGIQLGSCVFADQAICGVADESTSTAQAIRRSIDHGANKIFSTKSTSHDPASDRFADISFWQQGPEIELQFPAEDDPGTSFSVRLKLNQARVLADVLEIMNDAIPLTGDP